MEESTNKPDLELSIIVAIIEGGSSAMKTCLTTLEPSVSKHVLEVLVPYDSRLDSVPDLESRFQWAQFIDARKMVVAEDHGDSSREHHDLLRAVGLNLAKAPIVALLEDHGTPSANWCDAVLAAHRNSDASGVGGAVENGLDRLLNWAVYYCDFGRYQNPVPSGPVEFLSDSNVSYKRDALWSVKHLWADAFHETSVNWQLCRNGATLLLDPAMVVYQTRQNLRFFAALRERFVWGRSFAGTRALEISSLHRVLFAALSFLLPFVLTLRILALGIKKKRFLTKLLLSLPIIFLLQNFWALGEFVGYITRRTSADRKVRVQVAT